MKICADIQQLRAQVARWRSAGERIALVPTMGNLHAGHLSLIETARARADRVIASVFVNPSQFGPGEDLDAYPRSPADDQAKLSTAGTDLLYLPTQEAIYPFGVQAMTRVTVPELSALLCGASRPGHFEGVTSVVCRLFNIVQPDSAVFGQKDYQQLLLIQRMVTDLHLPIRILSAPIVRAEDGLALSSRNQYLGEAERAQAPALYAALQQAGRDIEGGRDDFAALEAEGAARLLAAGMRPDYFAVRRAADLAPPRAGHDSWGVLAAAYGGSARLSDNILLN
ncbi:MAG: pantoate--beta-alanine ligase [Gammaproteobacteria bacterium]